MFEMLQTKKQTNTIKRLVKNPINIATFFLNKSKIQK